MDRPTFDYSKLNGRIREVFGTQKKFAESMRISSATISKKLTGKTYFDQQEVFQATELLGIRPGDITVYFFTQRL